MRKGVNVQTVPAHRAAAKRLDELEKTSKEVEKLIHIIDGHLIQRLRSHRAITRKEEDVHKMLLKKAVPDVHKVLERIEPLRKALETRQSKILRAHAQHVLDRTAHARRTLETINNDIEQSISQWQSAVKQLRQESDEARALIQAIKKLRDHEERLAAALEKEGLVPKVKRRTKL